MAEQLAQKPTHFQKLSPQSQSGFPGGVTSVARAPPVYLQFFLLQQALPALGSPGGPYGLL